VTKPFTRREFLKTGGLAGGVNEERSVSALLSAFVLSVMLVGCDEKNPRNRDGDAGLARPNILLIVADDLGYSDIGSFGSAISTPNIDALAAEGVTFTQFHVFPNCGPTRGAMMTGVDPHRAGLGGNPEVAADNQKGQPGYEGHLRSDVVTIAELLRDAGYHTYMAGKWHLGKDGNDPSSRGFERSFALLNGGASHWADQAAIIPGSATLYTNDGQPVDDLPDGFYSSTWFSDKLKSYLDADKSDDAPFFAYLSFTAPHNPLHAPQEYIDRYKGRFDGGWDELAKARLARQRELGLVGEDQRPQPRPAWIMGWDELNPAQQASRARDMEIYAAMIAYMDASIGRIFDYLRHIDKYEDTLIVLISDNGPSRTSIMDYLALGGASGEFFRQFDNSLANKGMPGSSTDIGPGWAYAAATPLRLFKGYVAQGGIQVPAIIKLPGKAANTGVRTQQLTHVVDLMPTFLSVAEATYPEIYKDERIVPLQGESLLPLLTGESPVRSDTREFGWSAYGMDAFRRGHWKALRLPKPYGSGDWQLYDLAADPGEMHDLSSEFPDIVSGLADAWEQYAKTNGVIQPSTTTAYAKPVVGRKF